MHKTFNPLSPHLLLGVALMLIAPAPADAQAYCNLRDPVKQIYDLFPDATSYRSVVRTVGQDARETTQRRLPFPIHFNELGKHTLYVVIQDQVPVGLVHVRSEVGKWGLIEIAWALDLNLNIVDFRFQRCRDTARNSIADQAVKSSVIGQDFTGLVGMLTDDGSRLAPDQDERIPGLDDDAKRLLVTTIRSALKTVVVTQTTWRQDVQVARWIHTGLTAFAGAKSVEKIDRAYHAPMLIKRLDAAVGRHTGIDRETAVALLVRDARGEKLGMAIQTAWAAGDTDLDLWWTVPADLTISRVDAQEPWPNEEAGAAFTALQNRSFEDFLECHTAAELAGHEILLLADAWLSPDPGGQPRHED